MRALKEIIKKPRIVEVMAVVGVEVVVEVTVVVGVEVAVHYSGATGRYKVPF